MKTKKGGLDQIWVEDDGSGISKDDLLLAGVRFATSKLKTYDDLKVSPHMPNSYCMCHTTLKSIIRQTRLCTAYQYFSLEHVKIVFSKFYTKT